MAPGTDHTPKPRKLEPLDAELEKRHSNKSSPEGAEGRSSPKPGTLPPLDKDSEAKPSAPSQPKPPPGAAPDVTSPKLRLAQQRGRNPADGDAGDPLDNSGSSAVDTTTPMGEASKASKADVNDQVPMSEDTDAETVPPAALAANSAPVQSSLPEEPAVDKVKSVKDSRISLRKSLAGPMPVDIFCQNTRCYVDYIYRQAEQICLWRSMDVHAKDHACDQDDFGQSKEVRIHHRGSVKQLGLDLEEIPGDDLPSQLIPENLTSASDKNAVVRRQSAYILHFAGENNNDDDDGDTAKANPLGALAEGDGEEGGSPSVAAPKDKPKKPKGGPPTGPSPLKGLLTAKKVNLKQCKTLLKDLPDIQVWLEAPLDPGPPVVPKALVTAVASNHPELVALLVEFGANVLLPYDGTAMYKGWVMPGKSLIESVKNRKGRFVGTMLADRLEQIEHILMEAKEEQEAAAANLEAAGPTGSCNMDRQVSKDRSAAARLSSNAPQHARQSVKIEGEWGIITHTQGHPRDTYEIMEHLGDGDTSTCWEGWHKDTKAPVAIKAECKSDEVLIWEEINIMRKLKCTNIVKLNETFENDTQVFMVLELCEGGRLFDALSADTGVVSYTTRSSLLMKQLAASVLHLHNKEICHRDIQLENFLLAAAGPLDKAVVKLIDFTTAKEFGEGQAPMKTKICTPSYVAREILSRNMNPYTEKVDIWSLGVVFFIMLCGHPPFAGDTDFEILKKVKRGNWKFEPAEDWKEVPDEAKEMMTQMIVAKPEDRLSARGLTEIKWLR